MEESFTPSAAAGLAAIFFSLLAYVRPHIKAVSEILRPRC
jgi:hypothetical protein